jgi:Methane oxygenase PmoA
MSYRSFISLVVLFSLSCILADRDCAAHEPLRCEAIPIADHRVSFQIDGVEKFQWNFSDAYPRPFFYPFRGPSGAMLTRMGHPGAPDHDHHQSIWFANNKVNGFDFWANNKKTLIRQRQWLAYEDGNDEAIMACVLDWLGPDGNAIMQQELVAAILPMVDDEYALEIQFTANPAESQEQVALEKTNFAFLAVRVAKSISAHFGGGKLSNSEGLVGEKQAFAKPARWMDYSGPVASGQGSSRATTIEGITFFDHPANLSYPTPWHVRDDGWMGAAVHLEHGTMLDKDSAITLRYLLYAHRGAYDAAKATAVHEAFSERLGFVVAKGTKPHHQYEVTRQTN